MQDRKEAGHWENVRRARWEDGKGREGRGGGWNSLRTDTRDGGTSARLSARTTQTAAAEARVDATEGANPPHRLHTAYGPSIDRTPPHRLRAIVIPEKPLQHYPGTGRLRTVKQFH